jgi:hypothetical protein
MQYFIVSVGYRRYAFADLREATDFFKAMANIQCIDFEYSETAGDTAMFHYRRQETLAMTVSEIDNIYDCLEDAETARKAYDDALAEKEAGDLAQREVA